MNRYQRIHKEMKDIEELVQIATDILHDSFEAGDHKAMAIAFETIFNGLNTLERMHEINLPLL